MWGATASSTFNPLLLSGLGTTVANFCVKKLAHIKRIYVQNAPKVVNVSRNSR